MSLHVRNCFSLLWGVCCWSQSQLTLGKGRALPGQDASRSTHWAIATQTLLILWASESEWVNENENTVNLKSASLVAIMLLREGLTQVHSQKNPTLHFGESFTLTSKIGFIFTSVDQPDCSSDPRWPSLLDVCCSVDCGLELEAKWSQLPQRKVADAQ